jgi:hypothetical protein
VKQDARKRLGKLDGGNGAPNERDAEHLVGM